MDDQKSEESMPVIYRHKVVWEVTVGKKVFELDGEQIKVLKEMSLAGKSSIVWFSGFAISVPHISSIELVKDEYQKGEKLWGPGGGYHFDKISKEDYELGVNKILETPVKMAGDFKR